MKRSLLLLMIYVSFTPFAFAQQLTIGQRVPNSRFSNIIHYSKVNASMKGFLKKPLLIVFWNSDCDVSNKFLTELDTKHQDFKNELNVLVITSFPNKKVKDAFANKTIIKNVRFPVVTDDTIFRKKFPHRFEPHVVWVSSSGIIHAITDHKTVSNENLKLFISGTSLNFPLKEDIVDQDVFFSLTPIMINEYQKNKNKLFTYSYLGAARPGIYSGINAARYNNHDSTIRIHAQNTSAVKLFRVMYKQFDFFHKSRIVLEGNVNSLKNLLSVSYCYDLILKDTSHEKAYEFMRQDIDRSLEIRSSFEKRKIKVFVLKRKSGIDKLKAIKDIPPDKFITKDSLIWRNYKWQYFIASQFNESSILPYHIIDETNYKGKVDFSITSNLDDIESVKESFKKYDLELELEERELYVIVLKK